MTIEPDGDTHTVTYSRIVTRGPTAIKRLSDAGEAKTEYVKRIKEKKRAGYREVKPQQKRVKTARQIAAQRAPLGEFTHVQLRLENPNLPRFELPPNSNNASANFSLPTGNADRRIKPYAWAASLGGRYGGMACETSDSGSQR